MAVDLDRELSGVLGAGGEFDLNEVEALLRTSTDEAWTAIESDFGSRRLVGQGRRALRERPER